MSKRAIINKLDDLLKPLGFIRHKAVWNRRMGNVIAVIDVQTSKAGGTATINAGILDIDVYRKMWGRDPTAFVEEPSCTIRARIGELIEGKDLWWTVHEDKAANEVAKATAEHVLPFVERMHSRLEMVQWLTDAEVTKKRNPVPVINLAILQNLLGNCTEGCALLAIAQRNSLGAWREQAAEVAERLGCTVQR